jgi:lipopolysaccharide export LptBFGC system permease protein LptF
MFEQPVGKAEKDRSRTIIVASGLAVLVVIILVVLASWLGSRSQQKEELFMEGSAEFNSYAPLVKIEIKNQFKGERLNYFYTRMICLITNTGDKTLTGLQLSATAVQNTGYTLEEYQVLKEKILNPIPGSRELLSPNQSMELEIFMEPFDEKTNLSIDRLLVQVKGLKTR